MIDHRYKQSRFYNGTPATDKRNVRRDALVRGYLGAARRVNSAGQSYGGSTGGAQAVGGGFGLGALAERNADIKDDRDVFRQYGTGGLGARRAVAEARGFVAPTPPLS